MNKRILSLFLSIVLLFTSAIPSTVAMSSDDIYISDDVVVIDDLEQETSTVPEDEETSSDPTDPATGSDPTDPATGSDPTDPATGSDPTDPAAGSDPTDPATGSDPTDPATGSDPTDPATSSDPTDPATGSDPTDPAAGSDPTDPAAGSDPTDPATGSEPTDPATGSDPTDPATSSDPTDPATSTDPTDPADSTDPAPTDPAVDPEEPDVEEIPTCSCTGGENALVSHADDCLRKQYCKDISALSAQELYNNWSTYPADIQAFTLEYLSWTDQTKLAALNALLGSTTEPDEPADATVTKVAEDGTSVKVVGVPESAGLTVKSAEQSVIENVESLIGERNDHPEQLFVWDISVQNGGTDWQPGENVWVELDVPGVTLHKYTPVVVLHIADDGETNYIDAKVTDSGSIGFYTNGFSTFAGFTVDFDYNGVTFSINGLESILLSGLFDALKLPLEAENVTDLSFTDDSLISISQTSGDWLLTSLKAFDTTEFLTVTMSNGDVHTIVVTDAADPTIDVGGQYADSDNNNVCTWYATPSGDYHEDSDGLSPWYAVTVNGPGTFTIKLQSPKSGSGYIKNTSSGWEDTLFLDMHSLIVKGGAHVIVDVGEQFDSSIKHIYLRPETGYSQTLFDIQNGSIEFTGDSDRQIIISGRAASTYYNVNPLIKVNSGCTSFSAQWCDFRQSWNRAILVNANELETFNLENCFFRDTIHSKKYGGGAIYVDQYVNGNTSNSRIDIYNFNLTNCTFNGNTGNNDGGAIYNEGRLYNVSISGCSFTNCSADEIKNGAQQGAYGGAICFRGDQGKVLIENTTFSGCKTYTRGGAVSFAESTNANGNYARTNYVEFRNCTFSNCKARSNHGGAIAVEKQVHTIKVLGCSFSGCKSLGNGAAISLDATKLPDTFGTTGGASWTEAMDEELYGVRNTKHYKWPACYTTINTFLVDAYDGKQTTFTDCIASTSAGAIEFAANSYVVDADIKNTTIDGCKAVNNGSAIFSSSSVIESLNIEDTTIQNCDFIKVVKKSDGTYTTDSDGHYIDSTSSDAVYIDTIDAAGTVRSTGSTTCKLTMNNCILQNNVSTMHGGGLYWNAANERDVLDSCSAYVSNCQFLNNYTVLDGGGIYCEATVTVDNCVFSGNNSRNGAGIAQQVYSNESRMLKDGEQTNLTITGGTVIDNNIARDSGGGISIMANPTISLDNGTLSPDDPNFVHHSVIFNLDNATVKNNSAEKNGGGIYFAAIKGSTDYESDVETNDAEVDGYTKSIEIKNGSIFGNIAGTADTPGNGGGVYMNSSKDATLSIASGNIYSNTANGGNGGGIYMTGEDAVCVVTGGTIGGSADRKNSAVNGGGIAISGGATINMTLDNVLKSGGSVTYNTASNNGGGVWLEDSTSTLVNTIITSGGIIAYNSAVAYGGGIHLGARTKVEINEGRIEYNTAANGGGVSLIAADASPVYSTAVINGGSISYNTATTDGGGLYCYYYANYTVNGGTIKGNTATEGNGGGICCRYYGTSIVTGGEITENHADKGDGGGLYSRNCDITISGGNITKNTADTGGGITARSSGDWSVAFSNGSISENVATASGGGIFVERSPFNVTGGTISGNQADLGAGIAIFGAATVHLTGGIVTGNTSTSYGGGIHSNGSTVIVEDGDVCNNKALDGGGVYATNLSTVTVSGGDIYKNHATDEGGGIYTLVASVTITDGDVKENTAGSFGGGVCVKEKSTVTISGGAITKNEALAGGGIYVLGNLEAYETQVDVVGGEITYNKATGTGTYNGQGGGIHADRFSTININKSADGKTAGKISYNTAAKGGGVYVCYGAQLNVNDGHVTYNQALGTPSGVTTAYQANHGLLGTGGGIYVADGYSADHRATFTLTGSNIAIFGNTADFAADDVFASGKYTQLDVPLVDEMNMAGYSFKPEGWFEDYPTNDTKYHNRLGLGTSTTNYTLPVARYRGSQVYERVEIEPATRSATSAALPANITDAYVCMTLGIAGGSLKISKNITNTADGVVDANQMFIFRVQSIQLEDSLQSAVDMKVMVGNGGSVTITDLPYGTYMVTEIENWSWRYDLAGVEWNYTNSPSTKYNSANAIEISLQDANGDPADHKSVAVNFSNRFANDYWLSGADYAKNLFGIKS